MGTVYIRGCINGKIRKKFENKIIKRLQSTKINFVLCNMPICNRNPSAISRKSSFGYIQNYGYGRVVTIVPSEHDRLYPMKTHLQWGEREDSQVSHTYITIHIVQRDNFLLVFKMLNNKTSVSWVFTIQKTLMCSPTLIHVLYSRRILRLRKWLSRTWVLVKCWIYWPKAYPRNVNMTREKWTPGLFNWTDGLQSEKGVVNSKFFIMKLKKTTTENEHFIHVEFL